MLYKTNIRNTSVAQMDSIILDESKVKCKNELRAGEMAQEVRALICRHEAEKCGFPVRQEAEMGRLLKARNWRPAWAAARPWFPNSHKWI